MKLNLTKIYTTDKDKDGNPLKSSNGVPYTRMSIKAREYGDKWISGFQNATTKNWAEGQEVECEVKENGQYLNFEVPKVEVKDVVPRIEDLEKKVRVLYEFMNRQEMSQSNAELEAQNQGMMDFDDVSPEDIPF